MYVRDGYGYSVVKKTALPELQNTLVPYSSYWDCQMAWRKFPVLVTEVEVCKYTTEAFHGTEASTISLKITAH